MTSDSDQDGIGKNDSGWHRAGASVETASAGGGIGSLIHAPTRVTNTGQRSARALSARLKSTVSDAAFPVTTGCHRQAVTVGLGFPVTVKTLWLGRKSEIIASGRARPGCRKPHIQKSECPHIQKSA